MFTWFGTIFSLGDPAFLCTSLINWFRRTQFISTPSRHAIVSVLLIKAGCQNETSGTHVFIDVKSRHFYEKTLFYSACNCNKFILKKSHNHLSKSTTVYYLLRIKRTVILEKKYVTFSSGGQTKLSVINRCPPSGDPNCTLLV